MEQFSPILSFTKVELLGAIVAVVLIVEDDEQVRTLAESVLQDSGHETRTAAGATEALAILDTDDPIEILFIDLQLNGDHEEGLRVAQDAAKKRPGLPVIYTTGRGVTDGTLALFVEPNVFLAKPYNREQLLTALANVLKLGRTPSL